MTVSVTRTATLFVSLLVLVGLGAATGPGCHRRGGLHILSHSPEADDVDKLTEIRVRFDKPVVKDSEVGQDLPTSPLRIEPPLAGNARYADPQTLVYILNDKLKRSTEYKVLIASNVRGNDGTSLDKDLAFTFRTERLKVAQLAAHRPETLDALSLTPRILIRFSLPVEPAVVARHCALKGSAKDTVSLKVVSEDHEVGTVVDLAPTRPLARASAYSFECATALHGAEGNLGLAEPFAQSVQTYGDFRVDSATPNGQSVDIDRQLVEIKLTTPVDLAAIRAALSSKPEIKYLTEGHLSDPRTYRVQVQLEPQTDYTIKLAGTLQDQFAQKLDKDFSFAFRSGDSSPRLSIETGVFAVESSWPRYGLHTRNLSTLKVEAVRIPDARWAEVTLRGVPYSYYYDEDTKKEPWLKTMKLRGTARTIAVKATKNKWEAGTLELAQLTGSKSPFGLYAVEVMAPEEAKARPHRFIANVTNLGVTAKLGVSSGVVWVVHLADGKPAANVKVTVADGRGHTRFTGTTNGDGLVSLPSAQALTPSTKPAGTRNEEYEEENDSSPNQLVVLAEEGADRAVIAGSWQNGIAQWNFNLHGGKPAARMRGFLHTDRGLYRPSETVHGKGLVRLVEPGVGIRLPLEKNVDVTVRDPRGSDVFHKVLPLSAFGSFAFDVPLGDDARVGEYYVEAKVGSGAAQQQFSDTFLIAEYRPALFEAKLEPLKKQYQLGDTLQAQLRANYLYGAPLAKGKVTYSVRRREFMPTFAQHEGFVFADYNAMYENGEWWSRYEENMNSYEVTSDETQLNDKGETKLKLPTKDAQAELKGSQEYIFQAQVADESAQAVTATTTIVAHRNAFYLGLKSLDSMPQVNKPFSVEAVAVDVDGKPRDGKAELVITLQTWDCHYEYGNYYGSYRCDHKEQPLSKTPVVLTASGPVKVPVTVTKPGTIVLKLVSQDGNRAVVASDNVWAYGEGVASFRDSDEARFELKANKARYNRGETVKLMAQTNVKNALALVTVEREGVMRQFVRPLASGADAIEVPLTDADVPNVYFSVVLVRGRTGEGKKGAPIFRMGMTGVEVDAGHKRLTTTITTEKASFRPGQKVKTKISVKDADGKPVVAEVALAVADEGVLQLIGYKTPDPQAAFYAAVSLGVSTSTNWNRLAKRVDPAATEEDGEAGDLSSSSGGIRKKFLATAFWSPQLVTNAEGVVETEFDLPDNLTAFRMMAVATDKLDRFGSTDTRITVAKPLQAIPALPRFANVGDRFSAGAVVHNQTDASGQAQLSVSAKGITLDGDGARSTSIKAKENKAMRFEMRAVNKGTAQLTYKASLNDENDAVQVSFPIIKPEERRVTELSHGDFSNQSAMPVALKWPSADYPGSEVEVSIDPYGLSGIDESLRYLIDYPYGCLEQTTSRVIPMVMLEELTRTLQLESLKNTKVKDYVRIGIAKILRHQHEDGAFSLWPDSRPELFLTAFALYGLQIYEHGGYNIDKRAMADGLRALKEGISEQRAMGNQDNFLGENGSRAFALYVLAQLGQPDMVAMNKLFEKRKDLPTFGKALLAAAIRKGAGQADMTDTLLKEVLAERKPVPTDVDATFVTENRLGDLEYYFVSPTRTTAMTIIALLEVGNHEAEVQSLVRGLLGIRDEGRWASTQDNLFSLIALSKYADGKKQALKGKGVDLKLVVGGNTIVDKKGIKKGITLKVPTAELKKSPLLSTVQTPVPLSFTVRLRYAESLETAVAEDKGFRVTRHLEDPKDGKQKTKIAVGDLVRVVVEVQTSATRKRVAVVDRLAAGLEPVFVDVRHAPRESGDGDFGEDGGWNAYGWIAQETHDDRVAAFADYLPEGVHRFTYLARATTAGDFVYPAASAEEMYKPTVRGSSVGSHLTVRGN